MFEGYVVKIIKAESPFLWYADQIGKEFVVLCDAQNGHSSYRVVNSYVDVTILPPVRWIRMEDVEILRREKFSLLYTSRIVPF